MSSANSLFNTRPQSSKKGEVKALQVLFILCAAVTLKPSPITEVG